jgi:hypothetical protein
MTLQDHEMERAINLNGQRVTIRVPAHYAEQMEIRARAFGRSLNAEYGQAVEAWCGGGDGWTSQLIRAEAIHDWVTEGEVLSRQWAPVVVERLEMPAGKYLGLRLAGYMVTLDRSWFVSDEAFDEVRTSLANNLPLLAESGGGIGPGPYPSTSFVYGRPSGAESKLPSPPIGTECRKIGCSDHAIEYLVIRHTGRNRAVRTLPVPMCGKHASEARNQIEQGLAPPFSLA